MADAEKRKVTISAYVMEDIAEAVSKAADAGRQKVSTWVGDAVCERLKREGIYIPDEDRETERRILALIQEASEVGVDVEKTLTRAMRRAVSA